MTGKFVSFLFKRLEAKLDDIGSASSTEDVDLHVNDMTEYLAELKSIVLEIVGNVT